MFETLLLDILRDIATAAVATVTSTTPAAELGQLLKAAMQQGAEDFQKLTKGGEKRSSENFMTKCVFFILVAYHT